MIDYICFMLFMTAGRRNQRHFELLKSTTGQSEWPLWGDGRGSPRLAGDQVVAGRPADWLGRPATSEVTGQSTRDRFTCWWISHLQAAAQVGGASETRCSVHDLTSLRPMYGFFLFCFFLLFYFEEFSQPGCFQLHVKPTVSQCPCLSRFFIVFFWQRAPVMFLWAWLEKFVVRHLLFRWRRKVSQDFQNKLPLLKFLPVKTKFWWRRNQRTFSRRYGVKPTST